ncbi:MAG: hypothetical protein RIQ62_749 [Bacteroidota bacterium]|jgi:hypothetical protein
MTLVFRYLTAVLLLLNLTSSVNAQTDVTKFLGIPVDGYKPDVIKKLISKGYTINPTKKDALLGEFNGRDVNLFVVTNNNKVYRIMVSYKNTLSEGDIKIEFNKLCEQFKNNKKYISLSDDEISENEDISYEITVNNKRYQAVFYQLPEKADSNTIKSEFETVLHQKYTPEQISNASDELKQEIIETCLTHLKNKYSKKSVWFMITEKLGEYSINIFYDNELNQASGDDL